MGEMIVRDTTGTEIYRALPASTRDGIELRVPRRALVGASYPVVVDPIVGPEYSASSAAIAAAPGSHPP